MPPWQFFLLGGMLAATAVVIVSTGQTLANIVVLSLTILAVSFVGLAALRMLSPLVALEGADGPRMLGGRTRAALEREKALVLRTIKELEFDHSMGKVSQPDFEQLSARLRGRAIGLIQQLDRGEYRAQIERELAQRIGARAGAADDAAHQSEAESGAAVCPSCHTENDADARFCKQCGTRITA